MMFRVLVSEFRVELPVAAAVSVVASDVVSELAASEVAVEEPEAPQPARLRTMAAASADAMSFFIFFPS